MTDRDSSASGYIRAVLIAAAIFGALAAIGLLAWRVAHVLLVLFAAILLAVMLDALADFVRRALKIARLPALLVVVVLLAAATAAFFWFAGPQVAEQASALVERVPEAASQLESTLRAEPWAARLLDAVPAPSQLLPRPAAVLETIPGVFSTAFGAALNAMIVVVIGFYLALDPGIYRASLLALLPDGRRRQGERVLDALSHALRWWLVGRLASMLVVGLLTIIGLWLIDMPLVLALGLLAGLLSFIPFLGPILSAVPALLIGLVGDPWTAVWVLAVYTIVQFLEGNFITPFIQKRAVSLPPAGLLSAQLLMGVVFGFAGVVLATPLAVAVIVLVQVLYVRDVLGHRIRVLGEHEPAH